MSAKVAWPTIRPNREHLVDGAAVVLILAVALTGFHASYGGWGFLVIGVVGAVLGVVTAHVCRQLTLSPVIMMATGLAIFLVAGSIVAMRDVAIAGLLPTHESFVGFADGLVSGWKRMLTTLPPSGSIGNLWAIAFAGGFLPAWLTTLLARTERRALSLLGLPALVLMLSILFGTRHPVSIAVQGALAGATVVGWLAARRARQQRYLVGSSGYRRAVAAALLLGASTFGGLSLGPRLPFVSTSERFVLRDRTDPPFDPRDYGSPLNAFQRYLVGEWKDEVLFEVDDLPDPQPGDRSVYLRLAVMDDYDGVVWRVSPRSGTQGGRFMRVGESVPVDVVGEEETIEITLGALSGVWQPTYGIASGVEWMSTPSRAVMQQDLFRLSTVTSTGVVPGGWRSGDHYRLHYVAPRELTNNDVVGVGVDSQVIVDVQSAVPDELRTLAAVLTKGKASPIEQAKALEAFFRNGYYASGDDSIDEPNPPGHSYARLIKFVENETPVGNAEQYAAAMAIMARSLDLPARVVMGFRLDPDATEVHGDDVHAWVEIGFENGWKRFEPTSEKRERPQIKSKQPKPIFESQDLPPPPVIPPEPEVNARQGEKVKREDVRDEEDPKEEAAPTPKWRLAAIAAASTVGVGFLAFGGVVLDLKRRRRRRRMKADSTATRLAAGWDEYLDTARDVGRAVPAVATRRERALLLNDLNSLALATRADQAVFSGVEPTQDEVDAYWADVETARRELRGALPPLRRVTSRFSSNSLRTQDQRTQ